jgi:hypothetical protein
MGRFDDDYENDDDYEGAMRLGGAWGGVRCGWGAAEGCTGWGARGGVYFEYL